MRRGWVYSPEDSVQRYFLLVIVTHIAHTDCLEHDWKVVSTKDPPTHTNPKTQINICTLKRKWEFKSCRKPLQHRSTYKHAVRSADAHFDASGYEVRAPPPHINPLFPMKQFHLSIFLTKTSWGNTAWKWQPLCYFYMSFQPVLILYSHLLYRWEKRMIRETKKEKEKNGDRPAEGTLMICDLCWTNSQIFNPSCFSPQSHLLPPPGYCLPPLFV